MKKFALILTFLIAFPLCIFTSCAREKSGKISVVTTVFSEYDWVKNVVGEGSEIEVTMLLDGGADLHSYQPSATDIIKITTADMFIYMGGESDDWAKDVLRQSKNPDMIVVDFMRILGDKALEEEEVEGMEGEDGEDGEEDAEYDEHLWLSLKNAEYFVGVICEKLCLLDGDNAEKYRNNAERYIQSLKALDKKYEEAVSSSLKNTLIFADRFPFLYLLKDYGIDYYAAFKGCSSESSAKFETITFLAGKVDELSVKVILKTENSDGSIANSVKNATLAKDQRVLTLDSLQSASLKEYNAGRTYIKVMEENLEVIKEALN